MFLDAATSILAGLGLFFIGVKSLGANMSQLAGRSLRHWVARSTNSYVISAAVGTISGALTQSTNAITVILMSLASADLITVSRAKPILAWANVGTAALVLLAAVDIRLFVYALVGVTGLCFYLNLDRSTRWRPLVSAVLALGLLMLGIELIRSGSETFRNFLWLREFFAEMAQWSAAAIIGGAVLAFIAQSSATVSVLAIALIAAHLISFEQAMLTVYGASIGSGFGTYAVAARIRGASRQLALFQALIKVIGVCILLPLYLIEHYGNVPLLGAAIETLTSDPGRQIAYIYLACQFAAVATQLVLGDAMQPWLERWSPPQPQESFAKPRFLYDQAVDDPETALTLVDREQARVFALLPLYFGLDEHLGVEAQALGGEAVLPAAKALGRSIADFLGDLADTGAERSVLEEIAHRQERNNLLLSIHDALADLAGQLARPFESTALRDLAANLREGLGALLLTAEEAVRTLDPDEIALMRRLTADRDSVVDQLRHGAIAADHGLSAADHRHLYSVTSAFELIVWMLRRYCALITPTPQTETASDIAPLAVEVLRNT
ncbi:MAG TPA: Na/Pi symporter [Stellaceae bacterium]|nr:Na/Pi symporter [Stellaceae bacterium]